MAHPYLIYQFFVLLLMTPNVEGTAGSQFVRMLSAWRLSANLLSFSGKTQDDPRRSSCLSPLSLINHQTLSLQAQRLATTVHAHLQSKALIRQMSYIHLHLSHYCPIPIARCRIVADMSCYAYKVASISHRTKTSSALLVITLARKFTALDTR